MSVDHWDVWFIFLLSARLDPESRKIWEAELSYKDRQVKGTGVDKDSSDSTYSPAKFQDLIEFLEKRAQTLGMIAPERHGEKGRLLPLNRALPFARFSMRALLQQQNLVQQVRPSALSVRPRILS